MVLSLNNGRTILCCRRGIPPYERTRSLKVQQTTDVVGLAFADQKFLLIG